ncbi:O-acetyl-ADP-ribose deacetylase [Alkalibacterium olivapovliticus]|uniref:O-acetyl-ADP-ribose deacetylase (Regulator of RNase III) n=1 Tax=Alkalibacterium olivapovliticus TaxID=99907 RepID=A0A2T0W7T9_9LACT|nr:O-acetyl-ADP-ribose deacetylase [Alkalibacterium olivapovliticus]PRY82765.1 O-acetyl-ADP-ribose deacetylase (regulator of RNase III) [Alkalibacterium olivapovliticus]
MAIEVIKEDITKLKVDAIVNAANKSLLGGGGVDGAIHRAAGPELKEACKKMNGAETGEAKLTEGFDLPADYVIHTVGPVYRDGEHGEPEKLKACYANSLKVANEHKLQSVAFPAISTGIYGYPLDKAAKIAIETVKEELERNTSVTKVVFVAFDDKTKQILENQL